MGGGSKNRIGTKFLTGRCFENNGTIIKEANGFDTDIYTIGDKHSIVSSLSYHFSLHHLHTTHVIVSNYIL